MGNKGRQLTVVTKNKKKTAKWRDIFHESGEKSWRHSNKISDN